MPKKYEEINVWSEIESKINSLDRTRINRILMSTRLQRYSDKWKFVFFWLNIEAIIFVLIAMSESMIHSTFSASTFSLLSGIFSIYVILLQYYINGLNYNERSLKVHYHQLDIEDLRLRLKDLFILKNKRESFFEEEDIIEKFHTIMFEYQTLLKNNENHSPVDDRRGLEQSLKEEKRRNSEKKDNLEIDNKSYLKKLKSYIKEIDFTIDSIILRLNMIIMLVVPGILIFFLIR